MRAIDADKVIEKLKEHKSLFCKNRDEFRTLSDKDKARVDEIDTCIAELVNAEEVPHAQLSTNLAEVGTDCISRQAAIEAINKALDRQTLLNCFVRKVAIDAIKQLPPAQPERIKGHWIESNGLNILMKKFIEKGETWRMCDKCGAGFMIGYQYECDKAYHETFHNFCPNCGADMREVTT